MMKYGRYETTSSIKRNTTIYVHIPSVLTEPLLYYYYMYLNKNTLFLQSKKFLPEATGVISYILLYQWKPFLVE